MQDVSAVAAGLTARPGSQRERIQHVIVLMMENRSFDHLLGYLKVDDPDFPSLERLDVSCPVEPTRPDGKRVRTSHDAKSVLGTDPDHAHEAVMLQMYGREGATPGDEPRMDGFIRSFAVKIQNGSLRRTTPVLRALDWLLHLPGRLWNLLRRRPKPVLPHPEDIMKCFSEADAPVLSTLAKEFALLVDWHASVPGETWPNRNFAHAATADGEANIEIRFYENETIFEKLETAGRDWRIYHDGVAQVWAFPRLWRGDTDGFSDSEELFTDIGADRLPAYSFVEPNHGLGPGEGNSQHPGNNLTGGDSFVAGEVLMARIYNALVEKPAVFAKTLFLILYDEHGGFFDHVPAKPVPSPDGKVGRTGFDFSISGVRVPAVAISPLIPKGTVDSSFYDHATIPATLRQQFAPHLGPLSKRDEEAHDLLANLPLLGSPRTDCPSIELPGPVRPAVAEAATPQLLTDFEASLLDLAGAVKTQIEQPQIAESAGAVPPFRPDPVLSTAARSRVLVPGSPASEAVDQVVSYFTALPRTDPAGAEFGNG